MWNCKMCETSNPDHESRCAACGAAKPSGSSSDSSSSSTPKGSSQGVWIVVALIAAAIYYFTVGGGNSMAMYRNILLGSKSFISSDTGATATIYETYKCFKYDARYGQPDGFLLADVDNDNKDEVVVSLSEDEYRLVLDAQGSKVYGYLFSFREMKDVYADGTFAASSSADDSGVYYAYFDGRGYGLERVSLYSSSPEKRFISFNESNIKTYVK